MPALARLFPDAKVIACVRELPWVVDSIERLAQRNVFSPSSIFNYSAGGTVYARAQQVVPPDGMVGGPTMPSSRRATARNGTACCWCSTKPLTTDPAKAMQAIYTAAWAAAGAVRRGGATRAAVGRWVRNCRDLRCRWFHR